MLAITKYFKQVQPLIIGEQGQKILRCETMQLQWGQSKSGVKGQIGRKTTGHGL